jgi:predicted secreted protein
MIIIESLVPPKDPNMKGLNCSKYVKRTNLDAHVHVFKVVIQANSEIEGANIVNFFEFTFRDLDLD